MVSAHTKSFASLCLPNVRHLGSSLKARKAMWAVFSSPWEWLFYIDEILPSYVRIRISPFLRILINQPGWPMVHVMSGFWSLLIWIRAICDLDLFLRVRDLKLTSPLGGWDPTYCFRGRKRSPWLLPWLSKLRYMSWDDSPSTWVFSKIMVPQNGWFIMENPIKMGWFGG